MSNIVNRGDRTKESRLRYERHKERILLECKKAYQRNRKIILERMKRYASNNKDRIREYQKQWRTKNRESNLAKKRKYHHATREQRCATQRAYRIKNLEKCRKKELEYHRTHPEVLVASSQKRRAIIRATKVDTTGIRKWMASVRSKPSATCHWCGTKVSGSEIHFDHVVALAIGGTHTIGNLCVACGFCNASKHTKPLYQWFPKGQMVLI